MSRLRFDAVFFDVGSTLLEPYPSVSQVCAEILSDAGHARDVAAIDELMPLVDEYYEDRYRADDTFWTSEEATSDVWVGMYSLMCRRLGVEDEAEMLARRVYDEFGKAEHWRPYPDVAPGFRRMRESGLRLGVLSNWDTRLNGVLAGVGLAPLLDTVVCSADVGLHKPDPRIFELACARLGAAPDRCLHVGDHLYADVLGARASGLTAVLMARSVPPSAAPVPVIRSLDELDVLLTE